MMTRIQKVLIGGESPSNSHWLTRIWLIRGLGFIYVVTFSIIFFQASALWSAQGLLPIEPYVDAVIKHFGGSPARSFFEVPSLFYFLPADQVMTAFGLIGVTGGLLMLAGFANAPLLVLLWLLQLSFVNSGQLFYSFGWEILLLEMTILSAFLVPPWAMNLRRTTSPPPLIVIWALRWTLFRLMLGAGLIKIRGDQCWLDLTCLAYHYETQPNPHPLSYFYHLMPMWFHMVGTAFNHFVELIVPFGIFATPRIRRLAGVLFIIFQCTLISSGNLAWLNWATIALSLSCFDDGFFSRKNLNMKVPIIAKPRLAALGVFLVAVLCLSRDPLLNLFRRNQAMNTTYDSWNLINSYGAFGTIGKDRYVVVISGSKDGKTWDEFEFKCATSALSKRPCLITPYHYHIDWQMWFSAMRPQLQEEWLLRLAVRLLENNEAIRSQFAEGPVAPKFVKMDLYIYNFAEFKSSDWWRRTFVREYMPVISLETPAVQPYRLRF